MVSAAKHHSYGSLPSKVIKFDHHKHNACFYVFCNFLTINKLRLKSNQTFFALLLYSLLRLLCILGSTMFTPSPQTTKPQRL
eukprot:2802864-Amphidinium_carterae.1